MGKNDSRTDDSPLNGISAFQIFPTNAGDRNSDLVKGLNKALVGEAVAPLGHFFLANFYGVGDPYAPMVTDLVGRAVTLYGAPIRQDEGVLDEGGGIAPDQEPG